MKRLLLTATLLVAATSAHATTKYPGDDFIRPVTRIAGCIAIVEKVRDGTISPTEWMEQNREEFADLEMELKDRNYKPAKAREMMMGMAITLCMERKKLENTCVTASDPEKRDVQIMKTAHVPECWERVGRKQDGNEGGGIEHPVYRPEPPPAPINPWVALNASIPMMSPEDRAQYNEDVSIISRPVRPNGGQDYARFSECASYWQSLHHNRPPQVRQVLYSVRVARCMFANARGSSYALLLGVAGCPVTFGTMLQPGCYARF
jgi:hypothetical protein